MITIVYFDICFFIIEASRKLNSGASIVIIRSGFHARIYLYACLKIFKMGKKLIKISFMPITEREEKLNRLLKPSRSIKGPPTP